MRARDVASRPRRARWFCRWIRPRLTLTAKNAGRVLKLGAGVTPSSRAVGMALTLVLLSMPFAACQKHATPDAGKMWHAIPGGRPHGMAQRLLYSGQIPRAISTWQEALKDDPDNWDMLAALGATLYADGQFVRAAHYLQRAAALRVDDWTLRLFLATADYAAGALAEADREFQAIIAGSPNRGTVQIASDKLTRRYYRDQEAAERSILAKGGNPEVSPLWIGLLMTLPRPPRSNDTDDLHDDGTQVLVHTVIISVAALRAAFPSASVLQSRWFGVTTGGDDVRAYGQVRMEVMPYASHRTLVTARLWKSDLGKSGLSRLRFELLSFEYLLDAFRASSPLQQKFQGVDAIRAGRWAEAEQLLKEALRLAPDDPQGHLSLGIVYASTAQWHAAAKEYQRALELRPDYPDALFGLATVHSEMKLASDGVIAEFARAVELKPTTLEAYLNLAGIYGRLGMTMEASTELKYAKEVAPDLAIPEALRKWQAGGQ
jgi:tetratricopeptide (TPR) repeat protein